MGHPLLDLTNQTAVVIGGTSGIGLAITRALAQAGANVVPTGRRAEQLGTAVAEVKALGRRSLTQTCDVTDAASLGQLLQAVKGEFGSVRILVNCAGRTKRTPTLEVPESEWNAILEKARPQSRVIYRSAGLKVTYLDHLHVIHRGRKGELGHLLRYYPKMAAELHARDRVHTYGSFYIADLPD